MFSAQNRLTSNQTPLKPSKKWNRRFRKIVDHHVVNSLSKNTLEFCNLTSLHGFRNLANDFAKMDDPINKIRMSLEYLQSQRAVFALFVLKSIFLGSEYLQNC